MAFTKVWLGTTGDLSLDTNWNAVNVRSPAYSWTASGSGTNEYYLRTAANANPGFAAIPTTVTINGSAATSGSVGSLAAGRWGYGDNDTLGYSTLYVRLSDGTDPDTKTSGYVTFNQVPKAGETVRVPATSGAMSSNFDLSATALGAVYFEENHEGTVGSATSYLMLNCTAFEYAGKATAYIDLTSSAIAPRILTTVTAAEGYRGLYLKGSALTTVDVQGGTVGLASLPGETSSATTVRVMSDECDVWLGAGLTATTVNQYAGRMKIRCSVTTLLKYGGSCDLEEASAVTTLTNRSGTLNYASTGNITTCNLYGGIFDEMQSGAARTISTMNYYRGPWTIMRNKEAVTHTTVVQNDSQTISGGS